MSDLDSAIVDRPRRRRTRKSLIIDGKTWEPRFKIAAVDLETSDRNLASKNPRTIYHGGVAYCCLEEILRGNRGGRQAPW